MRGDACHEYHKRQHRDCNVFGFEPCLYWWKSQFIEPAPALSVALNLLPSVSPGIQLGEALSESTVAA